MMIHTVQDNIFKHKYLEIYGPPIENPIQIIVRKKHTHTHTHSHTHAHTHDSVVGLDSVRPHFKVQDNTFYKPY